MGTGRRLKVLVVDAQQSSRDQVFFSLSKRFECLSANSAQAAKEIFAPGRDDVAVAVLCMKAPASEILELSRIIKQRSPTTKVIILTGFAGLEAAKTATSEGVCWGYLVKPFGLPEVRDVVVRAVNAREEEAVKAAARKAMEETESSG